VTFYLPDKGVKVGSLLKKKDLFTAPRSKAKDCLLQWSVPKFQCESKWDAIPTLQKLGVKLAFTDDADFSALSDTPALITAIDQGTRFDMNEKGAEAAAYTHIAMSKATAVMPQKRKTVKMNLNRPFLYTITSAEGAVLFVGVFDGK
jgi:serpin B